GKNPLSSVASIDRGLPNELYMILSFNGLDCCWGIVTSHQGCEAQKCEKENFHVWGLEATAGQLELPEKVIPQASQHEPSRLGRLGSAGSLWGLTFRWPFVLRPTGPAKKGP